MQDCSLNICRRRVIFDPFAIDAAKLLIGNMKDERMIWPQSLVLNDQVLRHHPISIAGENDSFYFICRTHSQNARCLLGTGWRSPLESAHRSDLCSVARGDWLFAA